MAKHKNVYMPTSKSLVMSTCLHGRNQKRQHVSITEPNHLDLPTWQKLRQVNMSTSQNPVMPTCLHQRTHKCPPFYLKVPPSPPQTKITRNEKYKPEKYCTSDVSTSWLAVLFAWMSSFGWKQQNTIHFNSRKIFAIYMHIHLPKIHNVMSGY